MIPDPRVWRLSKDGTQYEMLPDVAVAYRKRLDVQLQLWVSGISTHTSELPDGIEPECCPDFSCCCEAGSWPLEERLAFVSASNETRNEMLMTALQRTAQHISLKTYVAGSVEHINLPSLS